MGRLSGSLQCVKYLLLTFNLIFLLAGSAIVAVGLWILFTGNIKELSEGDEEVYVFFFAGLYVLVGAGALMMLIGFFGCCGAARESQCLLGAFFACLLVIFAAEVTAGVFAFLGKQKTIIDAQGLYTKAYDDYIKNGGRNETLQDFHTFAKCCGNADPESAQRVRSLCLEEHKEHKNCLEEIAKMLNHSFQIVGILAVATAGVTIFGMIFSMVLCCAIRNSREML
ncbi:tetraspanin-2 isoform X1 [Rana temporaria]|uniref:tetraspanin-2 isoform X1 n=1 Tax=Rana temporaria TaxID=8407 RepID=UPI001AACE0C7|nr:tetraspanin-2 isoform X1 [Rana temporaria]